MSASRVFGIDLGTTYSCIAYVDENGKPVVVANADQEPTTPSAVYFESRDNIVVGKEAKNCARIFPDRVATIFKRSMGLPGSIMEADGQAYTPEMVSSFVLRQLAKDAEQALGEPVTDVIITCPAYFGSGEAAATENAGKLANLNVRGILREPTAAAIYYGLAKATEDQVVLVYDLGGGTFDVTVIAIEQGKVRVVCTNGDHNLGGKDWDNRLVSHFAQEFMAEHPAAGDPQDDGHAVQEMLIAAEDAKKGLTSREKSPVMVSFAGERTRVDLTRAKLEELTSDLLERTIDFTRRVVEEAAGLGVSKIDRVLLVGGLSKMPVVARRLKEVLNLEPQLLEPDLAVAKGAALQGMCLQAGKIIEEEVAAALGVGVDRVNLDQLDEATLKKAAEAASSRGGSFQFLTAEQMLQAATTQVTNVCSRAFGIVVWNREKPNEQGGKGAEEVAHLIQRNTPLPAKVLQEFGTNEANQASVLVQLMEQSGEQVSDRPDDNREIGRGTITGLPTGLPAGSPIEVTMELTEGGLLRCFATHVPSGRNLEMKVVTDSVMSAEEVEKARTMLMAKKVSAEVS